MKENVINEGKGRRGNKGCKGTASKGERERKKSYEGIGIHKVKERKREETR